MQNSCNICETEKKDVTSPKVVLGRLLYCTCPVCNKKVAADIYKNTITCPSCNSKASWKE